ncbi:MAG: restriction endonuclease, partial [bacterium]|nr:restriction endonuclease [bacterium]
MRDFLLHTLSSEDFEGLVVQICHRILGTGTFRFSSGPDGGRDGRFEGTASSFPSPAEPWSGGFVIQAKHTE